MSKSKTARATFFPAAHCDPAGTFELNCFVEAILMCAGMPAPGRWMERANDFAIHNDLNPVNRLRTHYFAFYGETHLVCGLRRSLEVVTGRFAIDRGEQHRDQTNCFTFSDP